MQKINILRFSLRLMLLAFLPLATFAQNNYFAGFGAGTSNTTGTYNGFVGFNAGRHNTTGRYNSFVGSYAGWLNSVGEYNVFFGTAAGQNNTIGSQNAFVGTQAGVLNTSGSRNTFLGSQAGRYNTEGSHNSFLGYQAGLLNTTGYAQVCIGVESGRSNTTGYANAFLGYRAGYNNTTGYANTIFGWQAGYNTNTGSNNVFLGRSTGANNVTGSNNVSVGNFAGPSQTYLNNATAIGYRAFVSASNSLVLGSINGVNSASANTKVGIGTTAPSYLLHVNGDAAKPGTSTWTIASDERLKQDITEFTDGLELVSQIKPVWFRYNGKAGMPKEKQYVGVLAQQMKRIAPYTVGEFTYTDTTGRQEQYLDYDANALTYLLVNAVKEQQRHITALVNELAAIKTLLTHNKLLNPNAENGSAARLWQNQPNPTDGVTIIRYYIPLMAVSAQIKVVTAKGEEIQSYDITERGEGQLTLAVGSLASGTYIYQLVVDNKGIDAKKLLLTR